MGVVRVQLCEFLRNSYHHANSTAFDTTGVLPMGSISDRRVCILVSRLCDICHGCGLVSTPDLAIVTLSDMKYSSGLGMHHPWGLGLLSNTDYQAAVPIFRQYYTIYIPLSVSR
jgi:hypothetical protein